MHSLANVHVQLDAELKEKAENIIHKEGLNVATAIRLFYKQICSKKHIPFDIHIPNKETLKAMKDVEEGKTHKVSSVAELMSLAD